MSEQTKKAPPSMTIRFSPEEKEALEKLATERRLSQAWLVRHAVRVLTGIEPTHGQS